MFQVIQQVLNYFKNVAHQLLIAYNHHATKLFQASLNVHKPLTVIVHPSVCFWVLHLGRISSSNTYIRSCKRTEHVDIS